MTLLLLAFTIYISLAKKILPQIKIFSQLFFLRKYTGIYAFIIAGIHGLMYTGMNDFLSIGFSDMGFSLGTLGFLIMLPLFLTSTIWAMKTMGFQAWALLHKLTHLAFIFGAIHPIFLEYHFDGELEIGGIFILIPYIFGYLYLWSKGPISLVCESNPR